MLLCIQVPRAVFIKFSRTARPEFLNKLPHKDTGDPNMATLSRFFRSLVVDSLHRHLFRDLLNSMHKMWCREYHWFRNHNHATQRESLSTLTLDNNKCTWWRKIKLWICIMACRILNNNTCPTLTMWRCRTISNMGSQTIWKQGLVLSPKCLRAESK